MAVLGPWPHGNPMPLTPQERERLAEIEAGLLADPHFSLDEPMGDGHRRHRRRTLAAAMMLIGIVLSVAGGVLAPRAFVVGIILVLAGFLVVVGGAVAWFTAREAPQSP